MEFVAQAAMIALMLKVVDFLRYARAGDLNGVFTQLSAWVGGVLVANLVARTEWAPGIEVGNVALSQLSFWSLVFYGMSAASVASAVNDFRKANDDTGSAAIPTLLPPHRGVSDLR